LRRVSFAGLNGGGGKARADKNSFLPILFFFIYLSAQFLSREARQSVGALFKKRFELRSVIATKINT